MCVWVLVNISRIELSCKCGISVFEVDRPRKLQRTSRLRHWHGHEVSTVSGGVCPCVCVWVLVDLLLHGSCRNCQCHQSRMSDSHLNENADRQRIEMPHRPQWLRIFWNTFCRIFKIFTSLPSSKWQKGYIRIKWIFLEIQSICSLIRRLATFSPFWFTFDS